MKVVCHAQDENPRIIRSVTLKGFANADARWELGKARLAFNTAWRDALALAVDELIADANKYENGVDSEERHDLNTVLESLQKHGQQIKSERSFRYPLPYDVTIEQRSDGFFVWSQTLDGRVAGGFDAPEHPLDFRPVPFCASPQAPPTFLRNRETVTGQKEDDLEQKRIFYFLWSCWHALSNVEQKSWFVAMQEEFEKQRAAFHSGLIDYVANVIAPALQITDRSTPNQSFFYKQLAHIIALGFNHPENPMPYLVYNAANRDSHFRQQLPLPPKIGG